VRIGQVRVMPRPWMVQWHRARWRLRLTSGWIVHVVIRVIQYNGLTASDECYYNVRPLCKLYIT